MSRMVKTCWCTPTVRCWLICGTSSFCPPRGAVGLDEQVLAQIMTAIDRFTDDELPAVRPEVPLIRSPFDEWELDRAFAASHGARP